MKRVFSIALLIFCGLVAMGKGGKPNASIFTVSTVRFQVVDKGDAVSTKVAKDKEKDFRQNFYFSAKSSEWEEHKVVLTPSDDGTIKFYLRAPNGAVAEYKSFRLNGEEKLKEPFIQPYSKKQKPFVVKTSCEKDKNVEAVFQIRASEKKLEDFEQK